MTHFQNYGHFVIDIILLQFNRFIIQSTAYYSVDKTESAVKNIAMRFPIYYTILTEFARFPCTERSVSYSITQMFLSESNLTLLTKVSSTYISLKMRCNYSF